MQKHVIELNREEFGEMVAKHVLVLITLLVLTLLVLAFDLVMVWVLQCHMRRNGNQWHKKGTRAAYNLYDEF